MAERRQSKAIQHQLDHGLIPDQELVLSNKSHRPGLRNLKYSFRNGQLPALVVQHPEPTGDDVSGNAQSSAAPNSKVQDVNAQPGLIAFPHFQGHEDLSGLLSESQGPSILPPTSLVDPIQDRDETALQAETVINDDESSLSAPKDEDEQAGDKMDVEVERRQERDQMEAEEQVDCTSKGEHYYFMTRGEMS
ncbi:hypothetical protein FRC10_012288 [Ceratobasidium sp. 414]|nr:hypothetical protein FRC10_012288 [Ceratobasidium sp. 414]